MKDKNEQALDDMEIYLVGMIQRIQEEYTKIAAPYVEKLCAVRAMRPQSFMMPIGQIDPAHLKTLGIKLPPSAMAATELGPQTPPPTESQSPGE